MKKRNIWIAAGALVTAAAVAAAVLLPGKKEQPVSVYPVDMISYVGGSEIASESLGMVTADRVQAIYISDTQTVTQVYVSEGDTVKKGDLLYTYDTTLTDLVLERKDLAIAQMELNLKNAREDLKKLKAMKPMVVTTNENDTGKSPANALLLGTRYKGTGTQKDPYLFWMTDGAQLSSDLIWEQFLEGKEPGKKIYVIFQTTEGNAANAEFKSEFGVIFSIPEQETPEPTDPTEPSDPTLPSEPGESSEPTVPSEPAQPENRSDVQTNTEPDPYTETQPEETTPENPTEETQPEPEKIYTMSFFDPNDAQIGTQIDWNSGYTQSELTTMRNEKSAEIKQLEFNIKMGKAELEIMKKEAADGKVYAAFDGVVVDAMDPVDAQSLGSPMLKISGGGGYYVEGAISELELEHIRVGQSVQVYCWDTGDVYTGTIQSVGTYPSENADALYGQVNVTYYPYTVFVDDSADLQEGSYVSLTYRSGGDMGILYLENAFLCTEGRDTYVYVRNPEGLLEKRLIQTGVSTDGYATPVYSGLNAQDYIAFPYDRNLREGAQTTESGVDELYGF